MGHVARMGYRIDVFVGRHEGKKLYGRRRTRKGDNIKMNFREIIWEAWNGLTILRAGQPVDDCDCVSYRLLGVPCVAEGLLVVAV